MQSAGERPEGGGEGEGEKGYFYYFTYLQYEAANHPRDQHDCAPYRATAKERVPITFVLLNKTYSQVPFHSNVNKLGRRVLVVTSSSWQPRVRVFVLDWMPREER